MFFLKRWCVSTKRLPSKILILFLVLLSMLSISLVRGKMHVLLALIVCRVNGQWRWKKQKYFSAYESAFL